MEHNNIYCKFCFSEWVAALSAGYIYNFQIFQDGHLFLPFSKKLYQVEEVVLEIFPCLFCATTKYKVITNDGYTGIAVEFWDSHSEENQPLHL